MRVYESISVLLLSVEVEPLDFVQWLHLVLTLDLLLLLLGVFLLGGGFLLVLPSLFSLLWLLCLLAFDLLFSLWRQLQLDAIFHPSVVLVLGLKEHQDSRLPHQVLQAFLLLSQQLHC